MATCRSESLRYTKKWCKRKVNQLISTMQNVRERINQGIVMPGSYLEDATKLINLQFKVSKQAVRHKWRKLIAGGHAVALMSPTPLLQEGPMQPCITTTREWSEEESRICSEVMASIMSTPTIAKNTFEHASNMCRLRGVKVCVGTHICTPLCLYHSQPRIRLTA